MLAFDVGPWTIWVPVGAGAVVASLVIGTAVILERWRQRPAASSREVDVPPDGLQRLLQQPNRGWSVAGLPPEEAAGEAVARPPALPDALPAELPEDHLYLLLGGNERRASLRRWGNPTEVHLRSGLWHGPLHGLVVNRSTGGLGIFTDGEIPPGTALEIRAVEAPPSVPAVRAEARHCRKAGHGYFIGCQFSEDVPWEAQAWLG